MFAVSAYIYATRNFTHETGIFWLGFRGPDCYVIAEQGGGPDTRLMYGLSTYQTVSVYYLLSVYIPAVEYVIYWLGEILAVWTVFCLGRFCRARRPAPFW